MDIYTNYTVAYTPDDAIQIVTQTLQERDVEIYNRGLELGGWTYAHHHAIPATDLQDMFNNVSEVTRKANEAAANREKNELMQTIIDNKDVELLHKNIDLFSKPEQKYIHDKIA